MNEQMDLAAENVELAAELAESERIAEQLHRANAEADQAIRDLQYRLDHTANMLDGLIRKAGAWDMPEFDGTDAAHPAWWRGSDHAARYMQPRIDAMTCLVESAIARIEVANAEGNPILAAWLVDAREALDIRPAKG